MNFKVAFITSLVSCIFRSNYADGIAHCTNVTRTHFGFTIQFDFHCGGLPCSCGTFVNGDWWVVPDPQSGYVTLTGASPAGEDHGMEVNPTDGLMQGILSGYDNYNSSRNLMTQLPMNFGPASSLVKMVRRSDPSLCGTSAIKTHGCAEIYEVLTILESALDTSSMSYFRPAFATNSSWKSPLVSTSSLSTWRLPNMTMVDDTAIDFQECAEIWRVPQYDNMNLAGVSEQMRATSPAAALADYAADQAVQFLNDLISTFGVRHWDDAKKDCLYALVQRGIDIFGAYVSGIRFGTGAGQHLGKQPPVTLYAALSNDKWVVNMVRGISQSTEEIFQESTQIRRTRGGLVLWGDTDNLNPYCNGLADESDSSDPSDNYWSQLFDEYFARYHSATGHDNKGTRCDPHGYIDGPAGLSPTLSLGRSYIGCCSMGTLVAYWAILRMVPSMAFVHNDNSTLEDFVISHYLGMSSGDGLYYGQFLTLPDPCAPPDSREDPDICKPYKARATEGCAYYRVTWGPVEGAPGECIFSAENTSSSRWNLRNHEHFEINRLPAMFQALPFDIFKNCSDPSSTEPCQGIGFEYEWSEEPSAAPTAAPTPSDLVRFECSVVLICTSATASTKQKLSLYNAISESLGENLVDIESFELTVTANAQDRRLDSLSNPASSRKLGSEYQWVATFQAIVSLSEIGAVDESILVFSVTGILSFFLPTKFNKDPELNGIGLLGNIIVQTHLVENIDSSPEPSVVPTAVLPSNRDSSVDLVMISSSAALILFVSSLLVCFVSYRNRKTTLNTNVISSEQLKRLQEHGFESLDALLNFMDQEKQRSPKPSGSLVLQKNDLGSTI